MDTPELKRPTRQLGNWITRYMSGRASPELKLHPSLGLAQAEADFQRRYPAYKRTVKLDQLRATEYARLDQHGHVYLDYTGGGLYAESQLRDHLALLNDQVFGNPHSKNLTSMAMTELVAQTRDSVLRYFNADPDEYVAIFTPNATGALKLIGESYPFAPGSNYLLTFDNHNSVNGIREFARSSGATVTYIPIIAPEMRVEPRALADAFELARPGAHHLFAYPAQSNFTGVQHPLEWIEQACSCGLAPIVGVPCAEGQLGGATSEECMRELRVLRKPLLLAVPGMEQATIRAYLPYHIDADEVLQEGYCISRPTCRYRCRPCLLYNGWCDHCVADVPTYIQIPDAACSLQGHERPPKARSCLRATSVTSTRRAPARTSTPPIIGQFQLGAAYDVAQGHILWFFGSCRDRA